MTFLRKYTRFVLTMTCVASFFIVRFCMLPLQWIHPATERSIRRTLFRWCSSGILRFTGIRRVVDGTPPKPPYILVANHTSFLDIFVLASVLGCVFVARSDLANWPVFGFMCRVMNCIFVDRESMRDTMRVNALIEQELDAGEGLVLFPEGGVSQENRLLPFKPALLDAPAKRVLPVYYAAIHYTVPPGGPPASEVAIWRDGVSFFGHYFGFAAQPWTEATLRIGAEPIADPDRKALAFQLHEAVASVRKPLET